MPEGEQEQEGQPATAHYPFRVRSLTATSVQKVPGPVRYSSNESGVPFITLDLDWPGVVTVQLPDDMPEAVLHDDPQLLGLAFQALLRWVNENAAAAGKKVVADIALEARKAELGIGEDEGIQASEL
jgi:hypothetical protein